MVLMLENIVNFLKVHIRYIKISLPQSPSQVVVTVAKLSLYISEIRWVCALGVS